MRLKFNNKDIFYKRNGKGPVMVLLHGFLESLSMWDDLAKELTEDHTVICIDLPGHGKSDFIDEVHSMELFAEVVNSVIEKENIESVKMIGHSMGGYVALAFAELFPEKIHSLILLNSTPDADSSERKQNRNRAIELMKVNSEAFISMAITNLFSEHSRDRFVSEINLLKRDALLFPKDGIIATIKGMRDRKDRKEVLREFSGQKLMICGSKDLIIPLEASKNAAKQCRTPLKTVETGHMSLTEDYCKIVKIVLFID